MFIDINTIGPEGLAFDRSFHLRDLEGPSRERIESVEARLVGSVVPAGVRAELSARLTAEVPLQCSRCLEIFPWTVATPVDLLIARRAADEPADDEEASTLVAPEGKLQLEDVVNEQLYLNWPLKPVCREGCRGLCKSCGTNLNTGSCSCETEDVDPRMAPLLPFRKKLSERG